MRPGRNLNGVENVSRKNLIEHLKTLALILITLVLIWVSFASLGASGASADSTRPEPRPTSIPIGVHLHPGDEVKIYCSGTTLRVENIDDRTGVGRCSNDLEPEIYWPVVPISPGNPRNSAQDVPTH